MRVVPLWQKMDFCKTSSGYVGFCGTPEGTVKHFTYAWLSIGTPINLSRVMKIKKPYQRVKYDLQEIGQPTLSDILMKKFGKKK